MNEKTPIDPSILFKKIKNQFLAAVIGICVTIAVLIPIILSYNLDTTQLIIIVLSFLIIIVLAIYSIIKLNKYSPEFMKLQGGGLDSKFVAQKLSQLIFSFGENCLQVEVTDNHRAFAVNALATSLETFRENIPQEDKQFIEILDEIKNISESEKNLKEAFNEVLEKSRAAG